MTDMRIDPVTPEIGADVLDLDLTKVTADELAELKKALARYLVLFFRDQDITDGVQIGFARHFGQLVAGHSYAKTHPDHDEMLILDFNGKPAGRGVEEFHSDAMGQPEPENGALLRCVETPAGGGDTCWANMYRAYETLPESIQTTLDGLCAVNDFAKPLALKVAVGAFSPEVLAEVRAQHPALEQPVVRVNPVTGRKALYVTENYTAGIVGFEKRQSESLLGMLYYHIRDPQFQVRFRWKPQSMALWDNRFTQHCALADYTGESRIMHRVAFVGEPVLGCAS
jgi:taurine dioxygenase